MNIPLSLAKNLIPSIARNFTENLIEEISEYMKQFDSKDLDKISKEDRFTLDRFEGDFAICENRKDGSMIQVPKNLIEENAPLGSILQLENGKLRFCKEETNDARNTIKNLLNDLYS